MVSWGNHKLNVDIKPSLLWKSSYEAQHGVQNLPLVGLLLKDPSCACIHAPLTLQINQQRDETRSRLTARQAGELSPKVRFSIRKIKPQSLERRKTTVSDTGLHQRGILLYAILRTSLAVTHAHLPTTSRMASEGQVKHRAPSVFYLTYNLQPSMKTQLSKMVDD